MPNALQITDPNADNPLAQAPSWATPGPPVPGDRDDFYNASPLERWLAQQRAKNNARGYEPLPGITSGAPPKPWGLDRTQLPEQAMPPTWEQQLGASRPADYTIDPRMLANPQQFRIWRGGKVSVSPSAAPTAQPMPWRLPQQPEDQ